MKHLFTMVAFCFLSILASATQRTVNNNNNLPGNPGQFTDIPSAISASAPGDTILVAGSPTSYTATINLSKKIVLLGPGYNPDKQNPLTANIPNGITFSATSASGSVIMGFLLGGVSFSSNATNLNGVTIRRNLISSSILFADSTSNVLIAENVITGGYMYMSTFQGQYKLLITNNIFTNSDQFDFYFQYLTSSNTPPVTVTHNLFINGNKNNQLISSNWMNFTGISTTFAYNLVIENNIFYNVSPAPVGAGAFVGCTFDNNISFSGGTLPVFTVTGLNTGSGNINNTDPMMVSLFNTNNTVDYNQDNLRLKNGSPCINAATDHSNIGPTGGLYPIYVSTNQYLTGEPVIPEVKSANFVGAGSVAPGGTLQIQVKASKID